MREGEMRERERGRRGEGEGEMRERGRRGEGEGGEVRERGR